MNVLIVDDSYEVRDGLRSILTGQAGIEMVEEATDGSEAINKLRERRFDAVLIDVQTEERDWIDLSRRVKQGWPQTRVVLLLVHRVRPEDVAASGADGLLMKDSPREQIVYLVSRVLKGGLEGRPARQNDLRAMTRNSIPFKRN